jgi:curved DNA-binding protein CbpA
MKPERRNLYRILHVQPEAPTEVIRASYRTLMSALKAHPDLGGDTETAARINHAWSVLGDAEQRRAYDRQLDAAARRSHRGGRRAGAAAQAAPPAPPRTAAATTAGASTAGAGARARADASATSRCAFCRRDLGVRATSEPVCGHCGSPLQAPPPAGGRTEIFGRRHSPRFASKQTALVRLAQAGAPWSMTVNDVSLRGCGLRSPVPFAAGDVLRVQAESFDGVAEVVSCRPEGGRGWRVHARWVRLRPLQAAGSFVSARA